MPADALLSPPPVLTLADFTSLGLILPSLVGRDAASVIQELAQKLHREGRLSDCLPFYQAALNREFLGSTNLEPGMAFPHARVPGLKAPAIALGRSDEPLDWGPGTGRSVRLVFLMMIPATDSSQYLWLISGLARLAKNRRLVQALHAAPDAGQILALLRQVGLRTSSPPVPAHRTA